MELHSYRDRWPISVIPSAYLSPICYTSLRLILRQLLDLGKWLLHGGLFLVFIIGASLFLSPEWSYMITGVMVFGIFGLVIIQLLKAKAIS